MNTNNFVENRYQAGDLVQFCSSYLKRNKTSEKQIGKVASVMNQYCWVVPQNSEKELCFHCLELRKVGETTAIQQRLAELETE